ncbi:hypothetical protein DK37_22205 [Halomonas sp. SUBG004]|nr:hypothetical protein DK37_22205 [Halomonas sp. SUBG004]
MVIPEGVTHALAQAVQTFVQAALNGECGITRDMVHFARGRGVTESTLQRHAGYPSGLPVVFIPHLPLLSF